MDPKATIKKLNNLSFKAEKFTVHFKAFSQGKNAFGVLPVDFSISLIYQWVPFLLVQTQRNLKIIHLKALLLICYV